LLRKKRIKIEITPDHRRRRRRTIVIDIIIDSKCLLLNIKLIVASHVNHRRHRLLAIHTTKVYTYAVGGITNKAMCKLAKYVISNRTEYRIE